MKNVNLLCTIAELVCLFPNAELIELNKLSENCNNLKIKLENNIIEINHYFEKIFEKIENLNNIFDIDSYYTNPIENLTIICDRQLWYRFYFPLLKDNKELFSKLENLYVERNVTIFFNFAILEAVNYEDEEDWFLYDFKFNYIKTSDYEFFKNKKNFYYDSFYSLYHILSEGQLGPILFPQDSVCKYPIYFKNTFENLNINNNLYKSKMYSHMCLKPRYHRIKFLLEAENNNVLDMGINNVNIQFLEEYKINTYENVIYTDNTKKHSKNHLKYFNKELYTEFLKITNKINITPDNHDFKFDHLKNYFNNKEYDESYIDIAGETHCIFDLKFGFFTEKSIKPILAEKFLMVYGSKKVYNEFKRIGIDLFLDEFELNGIEDKDELEQIDMIISCLKKLNINKLKNLYIEKYDIIKNNKQKMFDYYCKIMNNINVLIIRNDKNKLI